LKKVSLDRIINTSEKESFAKDLSAHQISLVSSDLTVLDKAIMEHNIMATSKIYDTISLNSLAKILQTSEDRVIIAIVKFYFLGRRNTTEYD